MKLYHFNPNTWGQEYFIMSDSEKNAIKALDEYLTKQHQRNSEFYKANGFKPYKLYLWRHMKKWKKYTIDVYEANQVIHSEVS